MDSPTITALSAERDALAERVKVLEGEDSRMRRALHNIRALAGKQQGEGGPNETFAHIEGFAHAALKEKDNG